MTVKVESDEKMKYRRDAIKDLPDDFKMPDKEILSGINQLFEMIQLNNSLINIMDDKIKLLEAKAKK
tara:strand:+ start:335 stop:535 length:201 start_codon:yes stop_codon:yes gene_type:complete